MTALFDLTTPGYRLRARGVSRSLSPAHWDGASVAQAAREALAEAAQTSGAEAPLVVGLIPFNCAEQAVFYLPQEVEWSTPAARPDLPPAPHAVAPDMLQLRGGDSPAYRASVAEAIRRIHAGQLDKVVLARRVTVESGSPIDVDGVYQRLCGRNSTAYVYRMDLPQADGEAPAVLLGASPELVLGSDAQGRVQSLPLAGSAPRGGDPEADQQAAQALLRSPKDLAEHALVVQAVGETFRRFADDVSVPASPDLVQTPVIWHLGTPISGSLRPGVSPLELVYALHPTPAVGGWPLETARQAIAELEDFDRGFYAGLLGWMDGQGRGEWVLVLRGGIVAGATATVYAGAGIVANSDPEKEHAETATKLRTFINALA
jgi:isochorismate synthase